MARHFRVLSLAFLFTTFANDGLALQLTIVDGNYTKGKTIYANVALVGKVTIESDLSNSSTAITVSSEGKIPLGPIDQVGFFVVRIIQDKNILVGGLLVLPIDNDANNFQIIATTKSQPLSANQATTKLVNRVLVWITPKRIFDVAKTIAPEWAASEAPTGLTTIAFCLVPDVTITKEICAGGIVDLSMSFSKKLGLGIVDLMEKDKALTSVEATTLRSLQFIVPALVFVINPTRKNAVELWDSVADAAIDKVENKDLRVVLASSKSLTNKTIMIYNHSKH